MAIDAAYQSAADRMPGVTLERFRKAVSGFDVYPVKIKGEIAGALLVNGPVIHACVLPHAEKRWLSKRMLAVLNAAIDEYGYAETTAATEAGVKFVESLGFEKDGEIYRSTKKWALNRSSARR